MQVDPIIGNPASSQSLNPYSYIGNNPLSGKDPTGYQDCVVTHGQCMTAAGAITGARSASQVVDANGNTIAAAGGNGTVKQSALGAGGNRDQSSGTPNSNTLPAQPDGFWSGLGKGLIDFFIDSAAAPILQTFTEQDDKGEYYFLGDAPVDPRYFKGSNSNVGQLGYDLAPAAGFVGGLLAGRVMPGAAIAGDSAVADTVTMRAASGSPPQLISGQAAEAGQLATLNSSGKVPFTPTPEQANSAAFRVIVGEPQYTASGNLVGTVFDGLNPSGLAELKNGSSVLNSSYQLRLQTYGALVNDTKFSIYTSRPVNSTFLDYLTRWDVSVQPLPK